MVLQLAQEFRNRGRPTRFPILRGDLYDLWDCGKLGNEWDVPDLKLFNCFYPANL
jgi:hypothetical protein